MELVLNVLMFGFVFLGVGTLAGWFSPTVFVSAFFGFLLGVIIGEVERALTKKKPRR